MSARFAGAARYRGSARSKIMNKYLGKMLPSAQAALSNPYAQFAVGMLPEVGVRLATGQELLPALVNTAVSEYAQGVGLNLGRASAVNGVLPTPALPTWRSRLTAGDTLGTIAGMGASTIGNAIINPMLGFNSNPDPYDQQPVYMPPPAGATSPPLNSQPGQPMVMADGTVGQPMVMADGTVGPPTTMNFKPLNAEEISKAQDFERRKAALSAYYVQALDNYPTQ